MRPVSAAKRSAHDPCRIKMARAPRTVATVARPKVVAGWPLLQIADPIPSCNPAPRTRSARHSAGAARARVRGGGAAAPGSESAEARPHPQEHGGSATARYDAPGLPNIAHSQPTVQNLISQSVKEPTPAKKTTKRR